MKKIVIIMMLLMGFTALAQKGERSGKGHMRDLSADQIATLQTKKATLALDLTEAQQAEMKVFFEEKAKMRKSKMEERKAQKESGATKELTSDERYAKSNERLDYQIAEKEKLKQILSEEQLAKWEKMKHRKGKQRKGKGNRGGVRKHKSNN